MRFGSDWANTSFSRSSALLWRGRRSVRPPGVRGVLRRAASDDDVLVERVRSKLGRWTSHPSAIRVSAADGRLTLSGAVLRGEHDRLLRKLAKVRGVREVDDGLEVHQSAGNLASLQGGREASAARTALMRRNWSTGPRLLAAAGGARLALYRLR